MKNNLTITTVALFISLFFTSCDDKNITIKWKEGWDSKNQNNELPKDSTNENRVWLDGTFINKNQQILYIAQEDIARFGSKESALDAFEKAIQKHLAIKDNQIKSTSCDCSAPIYLLEAPNLHLVDITPDPGNSSSGNNAGNTTPALNKKRINAINDTPPVPIVEAIQPINPNNLLRMAILDTGLDTTGSATLSNPALYLNDNFAYDYTSSGLGAFANDNSANDHGTTVTEIIAQIPTNSLKIIPFKIMNAGSGNLFDAICALFKAGDIGVQIINNSWGHSGVENEVLRRAMEYLETKNVTLVCSAGNEGLTLSQNISNTPTQVTKEVSHYPAMFSKDFKNVICATTTHPIGNKSNIYCNIAADITDVNLRYTSYAAAFVSNKLAKYYGNSLNSLLSSNPSINAASVVQQFYTTSGGFNNDPAMAPYVEAGRTIVF